MDIGQIDANGTSFDIDVLAETNSVLVQGATTIRWLWQNEESQMVILEKQRPVVGVGSYVVVDGAVGRLSEANRPGKNTVGRLVKPYSREKTPREVIVGNEVVMAYLQTIKLL